VTITLKRTFLHEMSRLIDGVKVRSRSHLIELALREYLDRRAAAQPDPLDSWLKTTVDGEPSDAVREHDLVA